MASIASGARFRPAYASDLLMPALAVVHGLLLCRGPAAPFIALGLWWNSNTISHNFIHRPFFRARAANLLFGLYLSVLLGIPQRLWRDRHLAHPAGRRPHIHVSAELMAQTALVLALWVALAAWAPRFLLTAYLPGYLTGLGICALHGHYEHAQGNTSPYWRFYN